jgi:hypothetical protein
MKPYYVVLSGARGNSGDDLIWDAALDHFARFRPDRSIVRAESWLPFDEERLSLVNRAKALILLGGPSIRCNTYADVYPLRSVLADIKVPILMLGSGYRDADGDWDRTSKFELSDQTRRLFDRIERSGISGVRCHHTLNVLLAHGYRSFEMTGCPAFYDHAHIALPFSGIRSIKKIAFATGRMYLRNASLRSQQLDLILELKNRFPQWHVVVAIHDPVNMADRHTAELIRSLEMAGLEWHEVARTASELRSFYSDVDLQVGYRVHAHIHMCSIKKPSFLLCEDGRGKGIRTTLGGPIFDAYRVRSYTAKEKFSQLMKFRSPFGKAIEARASVPSEIPLHIEQALRSNFASSAGSSALIQAYWETYHRVLMTLP